MALHKYAPITYMYICKNKLHDHTSHQDPPALIPCITLKGVTMNKWGQARYSITFLGVVNTQRTDSM